MFSVVGILSIHINIAYVQELSFTNVHTCNSYTPHARESHLRRLGMLELSTAVLVVSSIPSTPVSLISFFVAGLAVSPPTTTNY